MSLTNIQVYLVILSFFPLFSLAGLLTLHLVPALLILRSTIVSPNTTFIAIAPSVVELFYWAAVVSIPYADPLDRLLEGAKSKGGGSSGSYGSELRKHIEEPTCTSLYEGRVSARPDTPPQRLFRVLPMFS